MANNDEISLTAGDAAVVFCGDEVILLEGEGSGEQTARQRLADGLTRAMLDPDKYARIVEIAEEAMDDCPELPSDAPPTCH